jgi:hypothetical protein
MPEKQKTNNWTKAQTMIASGAMFGLLTLFNVIANFDRHKTNSTPDIASTPSATFTPVVEATLHNSDLIPASENSVTRTRSS